MLNLLSLGTHSTLKTDEVGCERREFLANSPLACTVTKIDAVSPARGGPIVARGERSEPLDGVRIGGAPQGMRVKLTDPQNDSFHGRNKVGSTSFFIGTISH